MNYRFMSCWFRLKLLVPPLLVPPFLVPPLLVSLLLVLPLLHFQAPVPPMLRLQALVPMMHRQPPRVWYFLDCPRKFCLRPRGGYKKAQDFTRAGHRFVQSTLLLSFFSAPEA